MKKSLLITLLFLNTFLFSQNSKTENNKSENLSKAFAMVVKKWIYVDETKNLENYVNKPNELEKYREDNESSVKITLLTTPKYLVASYQETQVCGEHYTTIISLDNLQDVSPKINKFFVDNFISKKNILDINREGYDKVGRYWQNGTYNLNTKQFIYGTKEH